MTPTALQNLCALLESAETAARDLQADDPPWDSLRLAVEGARSWCTQSRYRVEHLVGEAVGP